MFVKNLTKKEIKLRSFDGYSFEIPVGVSWLYDPAADHLLNNVYVVPKTEQKDKFGFDNGHGLPPMLSATQKEWEKGGKQLCQVTRYKINGKLVPRKKLITIAQQRGISNARVLEYLADSDNNDAMVIADDINNLPVSNDVKYPKDFENDSVQEKVPQMAV